MSITDALAPAGSPTEVLAQTPTMLRDLLQRVGKTVLLVTHDLDEALYLAQRVVFLNAGEIVSTDTLIALGRERQLVGHLGRALDNGLTKNELSEVITHLAFYAGWPAAMTAALVAKDVFEKR